MVDERLGTELLGFGVPLLVLGDPFQHPPIKRSAFFTDGEPDAMITEVHRHEGSILELATTIREVALHGRHASSPSASPW